MHVGIYMTLGSASGAILIVWSSGIQTACGGVTAASTTIYSHSGRSSKLLLKDYLLLSCSPPNRSVKKKNEKRKRALIHIFLKMSKEEESGGDYIKEITELYFDIFDNHNDTLMYYLADTATLDWFGQTVKGPKNIGAFIKTKIGKIKHIFGNAVEVSKIGNRDTHVVITSK